jgi:hypothetical protein
MALQRRDIGCHGAEAQQKYKLPIWEVNGKFSKPFLLIINTKVGLFIFPAGGKIKG